MILLRCLKSFHIIHIIPTKLNIFNTPNFEAIIFSMKDVEITHEDLKEQLEDNISFPDYL